MKLTNITEWIKAFDDIDNDHYDDFIKGKLVDKKYSLELFSKIMLEFINKKLNLLFMVTTKRINLLLEVNEYFSIEYELIRFNNEAKKLLFFRHLNFLPDKFILTVEKSFNDNFKAYIDSILNEFERISMGNSLFASEINNVNRIIDLLV